MSVVGPAAVRIKICGMTREADAIYAAAGGVDFIGLNLWPGSPRAVDLERARDLAAAVRATSPTVAIIGVMVDPTIAAVEAAIERVGLDWVQFHGAEPPSLVARFASRAIKAIALDADLDGPAVVGRYGCSWFLLDTPSPARGGSGRVGDWNLARQIAAELGRIGRGEFLAGGLHPGNVAAAIAAVRPDAIDVASGVESAPGIKDVARIDALIAAVRAAVEPPDDHGKGPQR